MFTPHNVLRVVAARAADRYRRLSRDDEVNRQEGFTITEVVFAALFSIVVTFSIAAIALGAMDVLSTTQTTALVREKPERTLNEMTEYIQKATMIVPLNYNTVATDGIAKYGDKQLTVIYERVDDGTNTVCEIHRYNINTTATETVSGTSYNTGTLTRKSASRIYASTGEPCTTNYSQLMTDIGSAAVDSAATLNGLNTDFSSFKYYDETGKEFPKSGVQTVQGNTNGGVVTQISAGPACVLDPAALTWLAPSADIKTVSTTLSFARGKEYAAGWQGHDEITSWASPQNVTYGSTAC